MLVWRLALGRFHEIDGEGARVYGGRWNSPGVAMVYTATHVSLALLEQLVHFHAEEVPSAFRLFAIRIPDDRPDEVAATPTDRDACRKIGDDWIASMRSASLIVPSMLVAPYFQPGNMPTTERNVLLNPRHASAASWHAIETTFHVDRRLQGAG